MENGIRKRESRKKTNSFYITHEEFLSKITGRLIFIYSALKEIFLSDAPVMWLLSMLLLPLM